MSEPRPKVALGVDLAGSIARDTGLATLDTEGNLKHGVVHTDSEILEFVHLVQPDVIVVDAPLSLPRGRTSADVPAPFHLRECDRELLRRRIRFFPVTLGPMRLLTKRGMTLAATLSKDYFVFEGYPGASQDILGIPRKRKGLALLTGGIRSLGIKVESNLSGDELDALTCAYVGILYLQGKTEFIGDPEEGEMLLPLPARSHQ